MKIRHILFLLSIILFMINPTKENDFGDDLGLEDDLEDEEKEDEWAEDEGLEDNSIHEENEVNPARQTVDVDVPMPNHDIKNSFVVNLGAGEILDIQTSRASVGVKKHKKMIKKKHKKKFVKKLLM